jgi:hypothetical protein
VSILIALGKPKVFKHIGEGNKKANQSAGMLDVQSVTFANFLDTGLMVKSLESEDGVNYRFGA